MNIYKLFLIFTCFISVEPFKSVYHNKFNFKLFSKKSKILKSYIYTPKTINQNDYVDYLNDNTNKIIVSTGPAGTGKTLFACQKAITQMKNQEIDKIIITRPVVTVEEDIGFLPGNIIKKMDPWTKPIFDIFLEYYSKVDLDFMLNNGKIEICPLAFMRGRTFKHAFIIADEMQNSSPNQMKMLTTRLGINSRMVITGDLQQTDISKENGLNDFVSKVEKYNNTEIIKIVNLGNEDIERSEIVKKVIEIYEYKPHIKIKKVNTTEIIKNNTKVNTTEIIKNTTFFNNSKSSIIYDNDAALIPRHHIVHNFDIFFQDLDY